MRQNKLVNAFRLQKSISHPYHLMKTTRIGVANRHRYDYSVEDEYYEKPMTLLEAVHLPIPVHEGFTHISPNDEYNLPYHWNDVRFNYKPQHMDRRCFIHDNWMNTYNFSHEAGHLLGVMDEDLDWMMGDPLEGMHWKQLRSPIINFLGAFILIAASFIYPLFGLKIPQKDNPFYWRKKYASVGTMHTFQQLAMLEYGAGTQKGPESSVMITKNGFQQQGQGMRYELDNYKDLIC